MASDFRGASAKEPKELVRLGGTVTDVFGPGEITCHPDPEVLFLLRRFQLLSLDGVREFHWIFLPGYPLTFALVCSTTLLRYIRLTTIIPMINKPH